MYYNINYLTILLTIVVSPMKPKLCTECKYFKNQFFTNSKFGKCYLFPIPIDNTDFLVNGRNTNKPPDYYHCSIARKYEDMCGKEGKLHEKK